MVSPGDMTPVIFGIALPSAGTWMFIYLALLALLGIVTLAFWAHWVELGDRQYADPETRKKMNLDARVSPLGSRIRPAAERLAEPERSRALWWCRAMGVSIWVVIAAAIVTIGLYAIFLPA